MDNCDICKGKAVKQTARSKFRIVCENYKKDGHGGINSENRRFTEWYPEYEEESILNAEKEWSAMIAENARKSK